jgi:uncharacterized SAM-binding protein YcdF (DUF218 family)
MFFIASKTLGYLVLPPTVALLALIGFWLRSRRRQKPAWGLFWFGTLYLWLCMAPWGANLLLTPLERPYANLPAPTQADVILVLGGALDLPNSSAERLEYGAACDRFVQAVLLARRCPQAKIIFAGGTLNLVERSKTEASLLKAEAGRLGIAPERIFVDDDSRNTRENALQAKRLLDQTGGSSIVVITSAFHMRRSLGCLRKAGIAAVPFPTDFRRHVGSFDPFGWAPQAARLDDSNSAVREYVGLVMYRLQGYM